MRLPLLISGRPKVLKNCARVSLGNGTWMIESSILDSKVEIHYHISRPGPDGGVAQIRNVLEYFGGVAKLYGPCVVEVVMVTPGTERYIDIFASLVKDEAAA